MYAVKSLGPSGLNHRCFGANDAVGGGDDFKEVNHDFFIRSAIEQINMNKRVFICIFNALNNGSDVANIAV